MPINSKSKGKRGELEWVKVLQSHGFSAERGRQFKGGPDSPDVLSDAPNIHWEVKRVQSLNLYKAIEQAKHDAGPDQTPVVAHRKNHEEWLITLPADAFLDLLKHKKRPDKA